MPTLLTLSDLPRVLQSGADRVKENIDLLTRLDSAIGDGDHGVTMKRTADAMVNSLQTADAKTISPLLEAVGWNVMSVDGGSTGPLLGSFFMGMAEGAEGLDAIDAAALAAIFNAGLKKLLAQTPAKVGDKTMVDALTPAVQAMGQAAENGADLAAVFAAAAEAAAKGAESTKDMQAKFGRARNLGPRTLGHVDPGAVSVSLLFAGFRDGLPNN